MERAADFGRRLAIVDAEGEYTYAWLAQRARLRAAQLLGSRTDLNEERVAFLMPPGFEYVVTQWAIWAAGGIAVPLSTHHPPAELEYALDDTGASVVIAHETLDETLRPLAEARDLRYRAVEAGGYPVQPVLELLTPEERQEAVEIGDSRSSAGLPSLEPGRGALILYTSGTTSRPKGVVLTHANLEFGMRTLADAWGWDAEDRILHVLPLHHTHGIVNALCCALYAGATVELPGGFDARYTWEAFASGRISVFMAVPTIYVKLLTAWDAADPFTRRRWSDGARALRLMVSGSAALPVPVFERWEEVTGHRLLERYGMTEIGMALSNPYDGERRPGTVGQPLPGVDVTLVDEAGSPVQTPGEAGEVRVRGAGVFREYWGCPEVTARGFVDGWFCTGDEARVDDGYYRLLGRQSIDILKSGGYKISALEIEAVLRDHPTVVDCAVVGVEDAEWGERVCAAIVPALPAEVDPMESWLDEPHSTWLGEQLSAWLRDRLAPYKIPRAWRIVAELPRNEMGKVTKPEVRDLFPAPRSSGFPAGK